MMRKKVAHDAPEIKIGLRKGKKCGLPGYCARCAGTSTWCANLDQWLLDTSAGASCIDGRRMMRRSVRKKYKRLVLAPVERFLHGSFSTQACDGDSSN
ncbi:hypothetical protein L195_g001062 [Trifolium pratense]|uniref:Uncharacterized protein n=1 Tax=Trifolium pratense TaxID=57577 RepID=A0A2K3NNM7_TRIPR|nr:hypothetical protein L195_g001062 [Trifolium pratense]